MLKNLKESLTLTTVKTFKRDKIAPKACVLFPSKDILHVVLHYNKSERIYLHVNMENSLYKYNSMA